MRRMVMASLRSLQDVVFHEAAIPSVPRSINDPVPSHDININGTFNVLRAAKDAGVNLIDTYTPLQSHAELFPDGLHPDARGYEILARTVLAALQKAAASAK